MIQPWKTLRSRQVGDFRVFRLRTDERHSPRTGASHEFVVIESVDWVNVIAVTARQELILVEQFRHGTETVELEVPGGMMDSHDGSPAETGARELREETGYEGGEARVIAAVYPNPALFTNRCHFVLIENCTQRHPVTLDHGEDILTRLVPVDDMMPLVASGGIKHALVVAGLFHYHLWRTGHGTTGNQRP